MKKVILLFLLIPFAALAQEGSKADEVQNLKDQIAVKNVQLKIANLENRAAQFENEVMKVKAELETYRRSMVLFRNFFQSFVAETEIAQVSDAVMERLIPEESRATSKIWLWHQEAKKAK